MEIQPARSSSCANLSNGNPASIDRNKNDLLFRERNNNARCAGSHDASYSSCVCNNQRPSSAIREDARSASAPMVRDGFTPRASGTIAPIDHVEVPVVEYLTRVIGNAIQNRSFPYHSRPAVPRNQHVEQ